MKSFLRGVPYPVSLLLPPVRIFYFFMCMLIESPRLFCWPRRLPDTDYLTGSSVPQLVLHPALTSNILAPYRKCSARMEDGCFVGVVFFVEFVTTVLC